MTDLYSTRGWKNRRRAADARKAENVDEERAEVRRIRAALYQAEQDANEAALAAQRAALEAERCACPACAGTGRVTVEVAAGLLDAWHRYKFHEYKPTQATISALADIAHGRPPAPGAVVVTASYGMTLPSPDMVRAEPGTAADEPPKAIRPAKVTKPSDDQFTSDGALIEI